MQFQSLRDIKINGRLVCLKFGYIAALNITGHMKIIETTFYHWHACSVHELLFKYLIGLLARELYRRSDFVCWYLGPGLYQAVVPS